MAYVAFMANDFASLFLLHQLWGHRAPRSLARPAFRNCHQHNHQITTRPLWDAANTSGMEWNGGGNIPGRWRCTCVPQTCQQSHQNPTAENHGRHPPIKVSGCLPTEPTVMPARTLMRIECRGTTSPAPFLPNTQRRIVLLPRKPR
ncbi:unnamed protein product, partial [Ectocarpus sp. 8 AP-2014]